MHLKNFNLIMMLVAGIIVTIISIITGYSLNRLMYTLLVVLVIFFIIGTLIQATVNRIFDHADALERKKISEALDEEEEALRMELEQSESSAK